MVSITDALMTEHRVFNTVFAHIERSLPMLATVQEARTLAALVEAMLNSHSEAETNLAYVALDHMLDNWGELDRFHQDHQEIDARLKRVQSARSRLEACQLLSAALRASQDHFLREERTIFPLIESVVQEELLAELGQAWRRLQPIPAA
jgi:hemerythrin-like domain-containing protein